jgi:hypothetical protein
LSAARKVEVSIGPWFRREVVAIAVVLAALVLAVLGFWVVDEVADEALAIVLIVALVGAVTAHGRRRL